MNKFALFIIENEMALFAYISLLLIMITVPMIYLSIWYHTNIKQTAGSRLLSETSAATNHSSRNILIILSQSRETLQLYRDIESGKYGKHARYTVQKAILFVGWWLFSLSVAASLPMLVELMASI